MLRTIRKYIIIGILAYCVYFLLNNHIILDGTRVHYFKKSQLTFSYTFYELKDKRPETIMKIDELRNDGIGDLLVELGIIDEKEKDILENKYDAEEYE
ncbi:MAG: hypothetical protein FP814_08915 [Desulfobacterium sp.]|nr:hypothetical protein [Desulfobacterium sp.]MBU3949527.1 hypothetical protein [Pseudomonadota bacterium]MBU4010775.1 hypothetical protein [Pseudomonadota bacterium]MBU4035829.1 hypothetical protein [Pseudomonadota bacterium]